MFGHDPFYYGLIKKYSAVFGTLFNSIQIERTSDDGQTTQLIKVPLTFAPREKMLARVQQDPNIDKGAALILPHMAYEFTGMAIDKNRKTSSTQKIKIGSNVYYNPVPYVFGYRLQIYSNTMEDGLKIVEQITPFFQNDFTASVELFQGQTPVDIPIVLGEMSYQDMYLGDLKDKRAVYWELNFALKGKMYGPANTAPGVIKYVNLNFYTDLIENSPLMAENVYIAPGETANGQPTTDPKQTIPPAQINATDNWDYIVEYNDEHQ